MSAPPDQPRGWFQSLRRIGESALALARSRLELFSVEWQEEKLRLVSLLLWVGLILIIGGTGFLVGLAALAIGLWQLAGYPGLIGLAAGALAVAAILVWYLRVKIRKGPKVFAQTLAEFRKDGECLQKRS